MRMTRKKDKYPCRMAGGCPADDWMYKLFGKYPAANDMCQYCPFQKYINHLADLEDELEMWEDDRK